MARRGKLCRSVEGRPRGDPVSAGAKHQRAVRYGIPSKARRYDFSPGVRRRRPALIVTRSGAASPTRRPLRAEAAGAGPPQQAKTAHRERGQQKRQRVRLGNERAGTDREPDLVATVDAQAERIEEPDIAIAGDLDVEDRAVIQRQREPGNAPVETGLGTQIADRIGREKTSRRKELEAGIREKADYRQAGPARTGEIKV